MKRLIYADNAATSKLDMQAFEAMKPYIFEEFGNASQSYSFSRSAKNALKIARDTIASCINASADEIYFTSGGTESDNWALKGIINDHDSRCSLITSQIEHHAILNSAKSIQQRGISVTYLPVDLSGTVIPASLKQYISDSTALVSIMLSNNEIGTIQPIRDLVAIAHEHKVLFHTDAVQSVGHIPIDVKELNVDMLSASGHKFNGPKGIGFLYIKKGTPIKPFHEGGMQEFGMRSGTENIASIVGMATALKKNCEQMKTHKKHLYALEKELLEGLTNAGIDFIRNGAANHVPGNLSLSFKDSNGEMLLHRLDLMGICVSTGSACDSNNTQISHVIKAIEVPERYAQGTIRISLGKDNTSEEVQIIVDCLKKIMSPLN